MYIFFASYQNANDEFRPFIIDDYSTTEGWISQPGKITPIPDGSLDILTVQDCDLEQCIYRLSTSSCNKQQITGEGSHVKQIYGVRPNYNFPSYEDDGTKFGYTVIFQAVKHNEGTNEKNYHIQRVRKYRFHCFKTVSTIEI